MPSSRKSKDIWFSPYGIYKHHYRLAKILGLEAIEKVGKLKPVREARITAITALAMYKMTGKPAFVQLCASDPPDAFIMQRSTEVRGQIDVSTIEVTSYREGSKEDFLAQIKRTKVPPEYSIYSEHYVLVVDLLTKNSIDEEPINRYLNSVNVPFPIWTFRVLSLTPDTIGEMVILNPVIKRFVINFGEVAFRLKNMGMPDAIRTIQVKSPDQLKEDEHSGQITEPPWDPEIEKQVI